ncbi:dimethylsulfoniopropionate demethylase [Ruegeria sp. 2205SS24-7]|uniref:dimethylsulfoniopropionate demethylase n=1 Tax=Ruegeria discodermiae TaxID=3064389 RepID=UPI002742662D|nr:dimethylsulfoniopropionate demethylase [Ruegeria sp. 2205SS24-7]MDP5219811.1 dimethylsulfoniopropionate demethylase [Ruegeria sp. 2205SS24-7]
MLNTVATKTTSQMPLTVREQRSAFWTSSDAHNPNGYMVYNHTLIPSTFGDAEQQYYHLKSAVQLWDVGCERQIELIGADAAKLIQMSTPRDISQMTHDRCFYIPTVDGKGHMTNDPVLLRLGEDRFWVSISNSDLLLYYKGIAAAWNLNVEVFEPEVSPLAIQGPKADELAARVWGGKIRDLRFFRHMRVDVNGTQMILARSGFSTQGGFELYFEGAEGGDVVWNRLMEAGRDLDVRAGAPHQSERIESGMLSFLADITFDMTPFEAGLGSLCETERDIGCLGWAALREKREPDRQLRPIEIAGDPLPPQGAFWDVIADGRPVGRISSSCRAYSFDCNAAIGLIDRSHWKPGTALEILTSDGLREATVKEKFWGRF